MRNQTEKRLISFEQTQQQHTSAKSNSAFYERLTNVLCRVFLDAFDGDSLMPF